MANKNIFETNDQLDLLKVLFFPVTIVTEIAAAPVREAAEIQKAGADKAAQDLLDVQKKSQDLLDKTTEEVISDFEAYELQAGGQITKDEEVLLNEINANMAVNEKFLINLEESGRKYDEDRFQDTVLTLIEAGKLSIEQYEEALDELDVKIEAGDYISNSFSNKEEDRYNEDGTLNANNIYNIIKANYDISEADIEEGWEQSLDYISKSADAAMARLEEAGILSLDEIKQARDSATGFLKPYRDLGETATLGRKVLSGMATPDELKEYSNFVGLDRSPLAEYRTKELESTIDRIQRAKGYSMSPQAVKELLEQGTMKISGEIADQVYAGLGQDVTSGLIASQTSADVALKSAQQLSDSILGTARGVADVDKWEGAESATATVQKNILQADLNNKRMVQEYASAEIFGTSMAELEIKFGAAKAQGMANIASERLSQTQKIEALKGAHYGEQGIRSDRFGAAIDSGRRAGQSERLSVTDRARQSRLNLGSSVMSNKANIELGRATSSINLGSSYALPIANLGLQASGFDAAARTAGARAFKDVLGGTIELGTTLGAKALSAGSAPI